MNILTNNIAHGDNSFSIYRLFEHRLGHKVYRPKQDKGWEDIGILGQAGSCPVARGEPYHEDGVLHIPILHGPAIRRFITAEQFLDMDFGAIIVSAGFEESQFHKLAKNYKPKCILIRQIGQVQDKPIFFRNCLLAKKTPMPVDVNAITYHPEPPEAYSYVPYAAEEKRIKSFSNYLRIRPNASLWDEAKKQLPEFEFYMHGMRNDDGYLPSADLPLAMQESMFIWHTKGAGGDGFVATEALASGRPMVVRKDHAIRTKTLAADYFEDGVNCIDVSPTIRSLKQGIKILKEWAHPGRYEEKCQDVIKCYKKHFRFEYEAQQIQEWLQKLKPGIRDVHPPQKMLDRMKKNWGR